MYEFWIQNKLLLMIGLSQFGFVLLVFIIINLSQRKLGKSNMSNDNSPNQIPSAAIAVSRLNTVIKPIDCQETDPDRISDINKLNTPISSDLQESSVAMQVETGDRLETNPESDIYKVAISPELFTELLEISNNPAETVDEAIRWWLRRRTLDALENSIDRDRRNRLSSRSYSSNRSQQELWND